MQVLRQQRNGWVWQNADVCWQGGWLGVAKCWCEQKGRKNIFKKKTFSLHAQKKVKATLFWNFFSNLFLCGAYLFSEHSFIRVIVTSGLFIIHCFLNKNKPRLILALIIKEQIYIYVCRWVGGWVYTRKCWRHV